MEIPRRIVLGFMATPACSKETQSSDLSDESENIRVNSVQEREAKERKSRGMKSDGYRG